MSKLSSVRGVGFSNRADVKDVVRWIDEQELPGAEELVAVGNSGGRVLAQAICSTIDVPGFRRAMMDGYAVRAESIQGASPTNPLEMNVIDRSMPGRPSTATWPKDQALSVVEIMTGAPFPEGANAVLPFEMTQQENGKTYAIGSIAERKHIGEIGEDIEAGCEVFSQGHRMRAQDVGMAASTGIDQVAVRKKPRVKVLITGNEIVPSGNDRSKFQIFDSNGPMLSALIDRDGGTTSIVYCSDDPAAIEKELMDPDVDVILVSGGSSVGKEDFAPGLLAERGELAFHGIAMRPSSPTGLGTIESRWVFLLPGNPVSCMCAYDFFAGRLIRRMGGRSAEWPYPVVRRKLSRKINSVIGRVDYCRVRSVESLVEPIAISGASVLSTLGKADGFVVVPKESEGYDEGEAVNLFLFEGQTGAMATALSPGLQE